MYPQIDGVSMGCFFALILANIFVGFQERHLFDGFPKPFIYLRYVDDTFVFFRSRNDAFSFFDKLNKLHSSLRFTMREENNGELPFLDVLVERRDSSLLASVYRKPTFTGLYLSWHSFSHRSRKLNLIRCLSYRALDIYSDCKTRLRLLRIYLLRTGIPRRLSMTI